MHPTHLHCPLLLLLTSIHAVAGEGDHDQPEKLLLIIFIAIDVVLMPFLVWIIYTRCMKQRRRKNLAADEDKHSEVVEEQNKDVESCRNEEEEAARVVVEKQEQGKITFAKGCRADFDLNDLMKGSAVGLGKGGFGSCYKTKLENEKLVVVKRLRDLGQISMEEFMKYMRVLSGLEHPNLLPLLGYYYSGAEKLLISNYACNGNLFYRIHGERDKEKRTPFKWSSRMQVAYGVAQAMEFLHSRLKEIAVVPHGNLKASNILLNEDDKPLVCDYGLLPLIPPTLAFHRTVCYMSPEYLKSRTVSRKTDVWSYGCLLLELVTGRIPMSSAPGAVHGIQLCEWVNRAVREEWTAEVFDQEIFNHKRESKGMIRMLKLALWCCEGAPDKRPEMEEVVSEISRVIGGGSDAED